VKVSFQYFGQLVGINLYSPQLGISHGDELLMLFKAHEFPINGVTISPEAFKRAFHF